MEMNEHDSHIRLGYEWLKFIKAARVQAVRGIIPTGGPMRWSDWRTRYEIYFK